MKSLIVSFLIFICNYEIFSQEEILRWRELEIFMLTNGLIGQTIRYKMEASSAVWNANNNYSYYFITTNYNQAHYPPLHHSESGNSDWSSLNQLYETTYGFNFIPAGSFWDYDNYAYGLYRISANISD